MPPPQHHRFFEARTGDIVEETASVSVKTLPPNPAFGHRLAPIRDRAGSCTGKRSLLASSALSRFALGALALGALAFGVPTVHSQSVGNPPAQATAPGSSANQGPVTKVPASKTAKTATIKSFRIIQEKDGPAVEILSTSPVVPAIQLISDPSRLVIDLPNARLDTPNKRVSIQADQISVLRADQFQANPPVARVVVDLLAPRAYTWDAAGNRLVVHLGKNPTEASHSPFQPPMVPGLTSAPQPVVKAVRAAGQLALASNAGSVGSSFTAADDTAVLTLSSGGEVRVCPGTTVSITPSQNRHNLMLGMNTGALETHVALDASSDSVITPDFRIMLVGPGEFHYAFSADNQGNTCVRALPGNTASAIVTELLGDRTYQVKATDQLVFRAGQLDRIDMAVPLECGCPPPRQTVQHATTDLPMQNSAAGEAHPPAKGNSSPRAEMPHAESPAATGIPAGNVAPSSPNPASDLHVQVSAPLVFHATGPPPAPVEDVRSLPLDSRRMETPELSVGPPPPAKKTARPAGTEIASANHPRGFFRKLGGFFAALFR